MYNDAHDVPGVGLMLVLGGVQVSVYLNKVAIGRGVEGSLGSRGIPEADPGGRGKIKGRGTCECVDMHAYLFASVT